MQDKKKNSTSVAWYKLADLIARGEREKALSVYRLLAHSLVNKAYALQLEGDILWSFDDPSAYEKYKQAAFLYKKEKRWIDAIAVCEHLLCADPNNQELLSMLCYFYAVVDWTDRFDRVLSNICALLLTGNFDSEQFYTMLKNLAECASESKHPETKQWLTVAIEKQTCNLDHDLHTRAQALFVTL